MLEANPDATLICTPDGRMVLSNAGATRLFETEHVALFNQAVTSLFPDTYARALMDGLRDCHEAAIADQGPPETHTVEVEVIQQDESAVPVEVTISSLRTAQGLTLRLVVRDISERRRQQREAEAKKDGFLATVSHELRTPLTSVPRLRRAPGGPRESRPERARPHPARAWSCATPAASCDSSTTC